MKRNKFINLTILSLISLTSTHVFISHLSPAYSRDNNPEPTNTENQDSDCYKNYETKFPEGELYCHALANTKIAEVNRIWKNLTAITKDNNNLRWENKTDKNRLLVVNWTGSSRYKKDEEIKIVRDTWVTVAPELQNFCKNFSSTEKITLPYRLNQLLGLSPEDSKIYQKRKIVEIWVEPKDLFRPTPDPEITDREAELGFPDFRGFMSIATKYKYWFLQQLMTNKNPWTKLGYTYDWGNRNDWAKIDPNRPVNVGLSEFIIRKEAPVKIESVSTVEEYCK